MLRCVMTFIVTAVVAGMMADTSPEWKKPADIMKLRRRRSLHTDPHTATTTASSSGRPSLENCLPSARKPQKRKNPFARLSSSEKTNRCDEEGDSVAAAESEMKCAETVSSSKCFINVLVMCTAKYFFIKS